MWLVVHIYSQNKHRYIFYVCETVYMLAYEHFPESIGPNLLCSFIERIPRCCEGSAMLVGSEEEEAGMQAHKKHFKLRDSKYFLHTYTCIDMSILPHEIASGKQLYYYRSSAWCSKVT